MSDPAVAASEPLTEKDLRFYFRSGRLCTYLVETFGEWTRRRFERITTPARWDEWLLAAEQLPLDSPATDQDLELMRELRRALYGMIQAALAQEPPLAADIAVINSFARAAPPTPRIELNGIPVLAHEPITQAGTLSLIARDAIDLFTGPYKSSFRTCGSDTCPVVFVDTSKKQNRKWCSTNCNARTATARYRGRQRAQALDYGPDGEKTSASDPVSPAEKSSPEKSPAERSSGED